MTSNLSSFTDILGDEINDSQPISLPSSVSSGCEPVTQNMSTIRNVRPPKHTGHYGDFRSREEIDSKYRTVFTYPYFNLVQSSVIDDALYGDKSIVVCAPTGSGKTVVFEMAIVQLLMELDDKKYEDDFKIIYMAPVKALCTERLTEWYPKFTKLGLLCIEVTGDTDVDFSQLKPYRIIITTPEKWDMLTRRWRDHKGLVEVIKLFLIDEVHILNDESRGPVLEAVVSRMKTIESSVRSAQRIEQLQKQYRDKDTSIPCNNIPMSIRFVAVSATVGNPADVAAWLGSSEKPAVYFKFGDECRPVKLNRIVEGYPCSEGTSIFKFDIILNYKLWPIIQRYHNGKPTLIFCNTRKSVLLTAETLSREITVGFSPEQKAKLTALASTIKTKKLQALVVNGVGCHHAGLLFEERVTIEQAFRNRDLPILITTTTLAMGVNLPAHLVIIKNTQQYVNGAYQEYSISTVLQMVGRAGRPQFDTEATAVIMTRLSDKPRYQALVGGSEPLQSYLHKRIHENLNSEAALGTISDVAQCVQWLRSTFLSVRAASDPKRYLGLTPSAPATLITKKLEELCVKAMNGLATAGLITMDEACCIESTEAGRLMSIFYLDLETMKLIMKVDGSESLQRLLWLICQSHELADMHLRTDERRCLNTLNRNNAAATIRYPMKGKISSREMKLNCVIQAILGCLPIPDPSLNQEAMKIMRIAERVCKCLVTYVTRPDLVNQHQKTFAAVTNSIILAKCITAHLWENSQYVSRQLKGIGPTFSTLLASAGKVNFMLLEESHPRDLERIMNKGPPAGNVLRKQISLLPKYQLTMTPIDENQVTIDVVLVNHAFLSENIDNLTAGDNHRSYLIVGDSENYLLLLQTFKDKDLISLYNGKLTYQVTRKHNFEHKILVHCISSSYVGIDVQTDYTFKDLQPQYLRREVYGESYGDVSAKNTKQTIKKQTNITDTFKERKRRNNSDEITQSKEKKKRDTALIEKFRVLKESFGVTSKEIRNSFQESTNATNKILQDLGQHEKCDSPNNISRPPVPESDFERPSKIMDIVDLDFDDTFTDDVGYGDKDLMDDSRINNILSEIEIEISNNNVNLMDSAKPSTSKADIIYQSKLPEPKQYINKDIGLNIATPSNRSQCKSLPRKKNIKKSNFTFIEKIENRMNDDDDIPESTQAEIGFSDAIKLQIAKFLNRSINETPCVDLNIQGLLKENINSDDRKLKESLNSFSEGKGVTKTECSLVFDESNKQQKSDDIGPTIEIDEQPTVEKTSQPKVVDVERVDENTVEENIISCSIKTVKLDDLESIEDINSEIEAFRRPLAIPQLETVPTKNRNKTRMETNTSKNSIPQKEIDNNNSNNLEVPTGDLSSMITIQNREIEDNTKTELIRRHHEVAANTDDNTKNLYIPLTIQNWNISESARIAIAHVPKRSVDFIKASELKNSNEITKYSYADSYPPNSNKIDVTDPALSKQSSPNDPTSNKSHYTTNVDTYSGYVNEYSFSTTKIDMCTKQIPDRRIHIIRKTKVDVDVTEIVTPAINNYREKDLNESLASYQNKIEKNTENESKTIEMDSNNLPNAFIKPITHNPLPENTGHGIFKENWDTSNEHKLKLIYDVQIYNSVDTKRKDKSEYCTTLENIKQKPEASEDKNVTGIIQPDYKENNKPCTVKDILSKYLNKLGKSKATTETSNINSLTLNRINEIKPEKPKRPYKICDIDRHCVSLPNTLIPEAPKFNSNNLEKVQNDDESNLRNAAWQSRPANRKAENLDNPNGLQDPKNDFKLDNPMNKTECISPEPVFNIEECPMSPEAESMLDQSMFNPKTLLQCLNNDHLEEEIIPPPPEFCDSNSEKNHSPSHYLSTDYSDNIGNLINETFLTEYASQDEVTDDYNNTNNINAAFEYDTSIFDNDSKIKLTPTKEIETWNFTNDDAGMEHATRGAHLLQSDLNNSWTIMHKNSPRVSTAPSQLRFTHRHSRLGQFKFSHKRNYKIVKRDELN